MTGLMRRAGRPYTLFDELARIQDDFNNLFDASGGGGYPLMNAWQSADDIIIEAELPGVEPADVDLSVQNNVLTISGERKQEQPTGENVAVYVKERPFGRFTRSIQLPHRVDSAKVQAQYRNGVLRIRLPRAEEDKPRKISVNAE